MIFSKAASLNGHDSIIFKQVISHEFQWKSAIPNYCKYSLTAIDQFY